MIQISASARVGVFGQAPGNLAHLSGRPFTDPSGVRLREWMGVEEIVFYDPEKVAIVPMAFCFPGYDGKGKTGKGGDLPPPKICAETWREEVMNLISPNLRLVLLVGQYAQRWHLADRMKPTLTETVKSWWDSQKDHEPSAQPLMVPVPHPSWRNNAWLKRNAWFEAELLPFIQNIISHALRSP